MATAVSDRQKIVYIAGLGASGTTLLSLLLSQMENVVSLGEVEASLRAIAEKTNVRDVCTCGKDKPDCEFWGSIINKAGDMQDTEEMHALLLQHFREQFPGKTLIDNSKFTASLGKRWLADRFKDQVDVRFIHLIRDYRGWALSTERIYSVYPGYKGRKKALFLHCMAWLIRNKKRAKYLKASGKPVLTLSYESMVFNPKQELKNIADFAGLKISAQPMSHENLQNHDCHGNSMRMDPENYAELRYDNKWTFDSRFLWLSVFLLPAHRYWKSINNK